MTGSTRPGFQRTRRFFVAVREIVSETRKLQKEARKKWNFVE